MSTEKKIIQVNGLNYSVNVTGTGKPIMLLHGFPDSSHLWRKVVPYLVDAGFMTIVPDLRGFGETDAPKGRKNYKLDLIADDCLKILDALGIKEKVYLAGHDWGSALGWVLAINNPDRFEKYMALSVGHVTAFAYAGIPQLLKAWYMVFFHFKGLAEWMYTRKNFKMMKWHVGKMDSELDQYMADMSRPGRMTAAMNWYRANVIDAFIKNFGKCKIPVLGIWSDQDAYLNEKQMKKGTRKYMDADFQYERISGAGHWLQVEKPEEFAKLAIEFCK